MLDELPDAAILDHLRQSEIGIGIARHAHARRLAERQALADRLADETARIDAELAKVAPDVEASANEVAAARAALTRAEGVLAERVVTQSRLQFQRAQVRDRIEAELRRTASTRRS